MWLWAACTKRMMHSKKIASSVYSFSRITIQSHLQSKGSSRCGNCGRKRDGPILPGIEDEHRHFSNSGVHVKTPHGCRVLCVSICTFEPVKQVNSVPPPWNAFMLIRSIAFPSLLAGLAIDFGLVMS